MAQQKMLGRVIAGAIGALIVAIGVVGLVQMNPDVLAGTLQNTAMMATGLGIQFFAGLLLITYAIVKGRTRLIW
jgi:hypothetical protein